MKVNIKRKQPKNYERCLNNIHNIKYTSDHDITVSKETLTYRGNYSSLFLLIISQLEGKQFERDQT